MLNCWYEPRRNKWAGLLRCPHADGIGFYIILGVVDAREKVVTTEMLNYFKKLLRAEALKKIFTAK
ncbi:MAG: hypothetical protein RL553_1951 [Planctomycetota bacterium]|jgi:hypothetical protein